MKKITFILAILSFFAYSCNSDVDKFSDDTKTKELEECTYSKDPSIVYANTKAETAFNNQGEIIELTNGMFVKRISDNSYIFDLDMLLTEEQVKELELYNEINPEPKTQTKGTVDRQANIWNNNTVYYSMNSNVTPYFRTEILAGIQSWREQSQIKFVERTNQNDYVEFILGTDGSYSNIGRIGGRQYIHLDSRWADRGTVMHEIGHAVGLIHEHQCWVFHDMPNSRLVFKWDNIKQGARKNYTKYSRVHDSYSAGIDDSNYPINSLMRACKFNCVS